LRSLSWAQLIDIMVVKENRFVCIQTRGATPVLFCSVLARLRCQVLTSVGINEDDTLRLVHLRGSSGRTRIQNAYNYWSLICSLEKQCSAVEARRAHNPEVTRSKRVTASFFLARIGQSSDMDTPITHLYHLTANRSRKPLQNFGHVLLLED
jgi:hypothetical protein